MIYIWPGPPFLYHPVMQAKTFKEKVYQTVFEADTWQGKLFDVALLFFILASIVVVMLESVAAIGVPNAALFARLELLFTIVFTIEYLVRIYSMPRPANYIFSFYGIIDLLSLLPGYIDLFVPNVHYLLVVRSLRLLRIFRIFKMVQFVDESRMLGLSIWESRRRIGVFLFVVLVLIIIMGSVMYVVERTANPDFSSIPQSIYWAVVTLTTVGYGDVAPATTLGKAIASFIMILGYAILAVPTGIITVSLMKKNKESLSTQTCPTCLRQGHDTDATYCKFCGGKL